MLLEDGPSGVELVFVDDDGSRGREDSWFVASKETTIGKSGKRGRYANGG
jgi:hypothetical protein